LIEDSNRMNATMFPSFYAGQWLLFYTYAKPVEKDSSKLFEIRNDERFRKAIFSLDIFTKNQSLVPPGFVLFVDEDNLAERIASVKRVFPDLQYETTIEPSYLDDLLTKVNPVNKNYKIIIYRTHQN